MNETLLKLLEGVLDINTPTALRSAPGEGTAKTIQNCLDEAEHSTVRNPADRLEYANLLSELTSNLPDFVGLNRDDTLPAEDAMDDINRYSEYANLVIQKIDQMAAARPGNARLAEMFNTIKATLNNAIKSANDTFTEYGSYLSKVQKAREDYDAFAARSLELAKQKKVQAYDYDDFFLDEDSADAPKETAKDRWLNMSSVAYASLNTVYTTGDVTAQMFSEIEEETAKQEASMSPLARDILGSRMDLISSDKAISQLFDYSDLANAEIAKEKESMWNTTRDFLKNYDIALDNSDYSDAMINVIYRRFEYDQSIPERLRSVLDYGRNKDIIITDKMLDAVVDYYKQDEQRNVQNRETAKRLSEFLDELSPVAKLAECQTKKQILTVNADKKYSEQIHDGYRAAINNCRKVLIKSLLDLNTKTADIWNEYEADIRGANDAYAKAYEAADLEAKASYDKAMAEQSLKAENNIDVKVAELLQRLDGTFKIGSNTTEFETFKKALEEAPMSNSYDALIEAANAYIAAKTADGNSPSSSSGKTRLRAAQEIVSYIQQQQAETDNLDIRLKDEWKKKLQEVPGRVPEEFQVARPPKAALMPEDSLSREAVQLGSPKASEQASPDTNPLDKVKNAFTFVKLPDSVKYKELSVESVNAERYEVMRREAQIRSEAEAARQAEAERIEEEIRQRELQKEEARRQAAANTIEGREMARRAEEISVYGIDLETRAQRRAAYLRNGSFAGGDLINSLWDAIERNGNNTDMLPGTHRGRITYLSRTDRDMREEFLPSAIARFLFNEYGTDAETSLNATEKIVNIIDDYITGDAKNDLGKIYTVIRNEVFLPKDGKPALIPGYDGVDRYDVIADTINQYIDDYRHMHQNTACAPGKTPREMDEADLSMKLAQKYNRVAGAGILSAENAGTLLRIAENPKTTNRQRELLLFINERDLARIQSTSQNPASFEKAFSKYLAANARPCFRQDAKGADKKWVKDFIDYVDRSKRMAAANPQLDNSIKKAMGINV